MAEIENQITPGWRWARFQIPQNAVKALISSEVIAQAEDRILRAVTFKIDPKKVKLIEHGVMEPSQITSQEAKTEPQE